VCIRGVNILGSMSSALTVTIVLNIRKLVSLLLSIWLFGNRLNPGVSVGAAIVFLGGFLYGLESQRQSKMKRAAAAAAAAKKQ
jgi:UDP-xylose/UDP-N-acetylglucosamine transporter B4